MDSNEIDTYLRAIDAELAQRPIRKPVRIVVTGISCVGNGQILLSRSSATCILPI